jgi:hypothetical protein
MPEGTAPMRLTAIAFTLSLAVLNVLAACSKSDVSKGGASAADYVAGTAPSVDRFSSPNGKFTVDLPGLWRGYYKTNSTEKRAPTRRPARVFRSSSFSRPKPRGKLSPRR